MDEARKLNSEIGFAKWFIRDLELDPKLNSKQITMMKDILRKLEKQLIRWELTGFDTNGNQNSFHHLTVCQN